jgi:hypothetical protein
MLLVYHFFHAEAKLELHKGDRDNTRTPRHPARRLEPMHLHCYAPMPRTGNSTVARLAPESELQAALAPETTMDASGSAQPDYSETIASCLCSLSSLSPRPVCVNLD